MEVILLEKIHGLGDLGEKVTVKPGFGRNYLVPNNKALPATAENVERFEVRRAELERAEAETLKQAQTLAEKLNALSLTVKAQVTEEGKLYGSVGPKEIGDVIVAAGVEIDKSVILQPDGPIHEIGEHKIDLQLHGDVTATVTITVVPEA